MAVVPKNSRSRDVPAANVPAADVHAADIPAQDATAGQSSPTELQREFEQLQERFHRTTTALASAAHDLKTPLAIVSGYVEVLNSEKLGPLNERQREILHDMTGSCQRLQSFIQDFLTYSVLETGELRMHFEVGDVNSCLSEVSDMWSKRFSEQGLALYFLANDKVPAFPFDHAKLQRVISNLLENASKFTPHGGTVWLHVEPHMWERRAPEKAEVSSDRRHQSLATPNAVKVSVADTGPGIAPEFQMEVFDDFFRLPGAEVKADGMGLGLAIARRLVHGLGGKIWVESEPGAGCKFSFLIPLQPVNAQNGKAQAGNSTSAKGTAR